MTVAACADLVRRGDPDRFLSAMSGKVAVRDILFPLYAFNLELARVPYVTSDPMIAAMRLQFWRDVVAAAPDTSQDRAHEVAAPLAGVIRAAHLDTAPLLAMIQAWDDAAQAPPADIPAFARATAGNLMAVSGQALEGGDRAALTALGTAQGLANWLLAIPGLRAAGRGFVAPNEVAVQDLAAQGLAALARARAELPRHTGLAPALRAAWRTETVLKRAMAAPERALKGVLAESEAARRGTLLWRSALGRW